MPIYAYECRECGIRFEKLQKFGAPVPETCPQGHARVHRLLSQPAIIFKGSGFYITDNGKRRNGTSSKNGRSQKKTESKTSAKTEDSTSD
jgi:putative FmdB family regulatory protein